LGFQKLFNDSRKTLLMQYQLLGKSSLKISRIGFGCMSLDATNSDSEKILNQAFSLGINFFDTADIYQNGQNEELLGRTFKGMRQKIILASKIGNRRKPDDSGLDWVPSKKYILEGVEKSLKRLQTEYIDLYQLHGGTIEDPIDEIIEAFELLKAQGKILFYGTSSIRPQVIREYVRRSNIVSVMMQYSLLDRRPEEEMLDLLYKNQIGVLARGSLAGGLLVSKTAKVYLKYSADQVKMAAAAVWELSDEKRKATQTALQFVLGNKTISSAVIGIRTMEHLNEAVAAMDASPLDTKETEQLANSIPANIYDLYR